MKNKLEEVSQYLCCNPVSSYSQYIPTMRAGVLICLCDEKDSGMMGEMILPVDQLDKDLTAHFLIKQLNSRNIFDFDYSPTDGDNLEIREEYIYKKVKGEPRPDLYNYLSFIFRNGTWIEDVYDVFNDKIKGFKKGKIKYIPQE